MTSNSQQCQTNLEIILGICDLLGIPLAVDKIEGPTTLMTFLGFQLDTLEMTVSLPPEKLERIARLVQEWLSRTCCTKSELDSLIGQLQHASAVVRAGRSFLRRMIVLAKSRRSPSHYIRLNKSFRSDLMWWHTFLKDWNGISLLASLGKATPTVAITSDASGSWGCGAFCGTHWFQLQWPQTAKTHSIAVLEFIPIIIAGMVWGSEWENCQVRARCDNQAVVDIISARYCRDDSLMHLLRCLFLIEARHSFTIVPRHIPGKINRLADKLSRDKISTPLLQEMSMNPHPTVVPSGILQGCIQKFCRGGANLGYGQKRGGAPGGSSIVSCEVLHSRGGENDTRGGECPSPPPLKYGPVLATLLDTTLDWTSQTWTDLLNTTLNKV